MIRKTKCCLFCFRKKTYIGIPFVIFFRIRFFFTKYCPKLRLQHYGTDCLTIHTFNCVFINCLIRYSDFVVHEINREGKIVQLDDLSIPVEIEVICMPVQFQGTGLKHIQG